MMAERYAQVNRAFSASGSFSTSTWGVAPGLYEPAPLALKRCCEIAALTAFEEACDVTE